MHDLIYLYAIAQPKPGQPAVLLPATGILPETPVAALAHGDLLAIVSRVPAAQFGATALEASLQQFVWARDRAISHQQVLAELLATHTLLPLKFCTLYHDEASLAAMLSAQQPGLQAALARLAGATEWGVKLFCARAQLDAWAAEEAEALAPQRAAIAAASTGTAYFLRKKLAQAVAGATTQMLNQQVTQAHQQLASLARAAVCNPMQPPQVHGRASDMLLNAAYLVDDCRLAELQTTLAAIQASSPPGLQFELTGPWPAYNFAGVSA